MTPDPLPAYVHSGRLGLGPFVVPPLAALAAALLAIVYAYVVVYSPIAGYVSILFVVGLGFGVGIAVSNIGRLAKVRSGGFMTAAGLLAGLLALYVSWAGFESVLLRKSEVENAPGVIDLLLAPSAVWGLAGLINETGWYSIRGATPSGLVLWVFWAIEAALVVGIPTITASSGISDLVFCERCEQWCETSALPPLSLPEDIEVLKRACDGELGALEALPAAAAGAPARLNLELNRCASCRETATLQLDLWRVTVDKEGKAGHETSALTGHLLLDPEALERVLRLPAATEDATASVDATAPADGAADAGAEETEPA